MGRPRGLCKVVYMDPYGHTQHTARKVLASTSQIRLENRTSRRCDVTRARQLTSRDGHLPALGVPQTDQKPAPGLPRPRGSNARGFCARLLPTSNHQVLVYSDDTFFSDYYCMCDSDRRHRDNFAERGAMVSGYSARCNLSRGGTRIITNAPSVLRH